MNYEQYQIAEHDYRYFRTTCGLVGFIVFFLGAFCAFIVAGETTNYPEVAFFVGIFMLTVTILFFCCVMNESKRVFVPMNAYNTEELVPLMCQTKPSDVCQPVPELPHPRDSDETANSETDPDSAKGAIPKLAKSGSAAKGKESKAETSKKSKDKDSSSSVGKLVDVELHSPKAGHSKATDGSSKILKPRSEISPLKGLKISLSDSAKDDTASTEKLPDNVSSAMQKLSLDDSKKPAAKMSKQGQFSTVSESKSDNQSDKTK